MYSPSAETHDLSKNFDSICAVDRLSLSVAQGEMFGLVGPDGAGKTTTMRMLCGILAPDSGTARILGRDIVKEAALIKRDIGYLSQRFSLYGDLSVDENIEFFAELHGVYDYSQRREELLEFTRLTEFRGRYAERLSGGMKQKLALACTLIHTPKVLFMDEPTTGVDPVSRRDFWRILQTLVSRGMTILMTTPYLDEAERCTRVGFLHRGRLMVVDTPTNIRKLMKGDIVEIVCTPVRDAGAAVKTHRLVAEVQAFGDRLHVNVANALAAGPEIVSFLQRKGIVVETWRVVPATLENVFISLLTHHEGKGVDV